MVSLLKILIYVVIIGIVALVAKSSLYKSFSSSNYGINIRLKYQNEISMISIFLISLLFGLYSNYSSHVPYVSDRGHYAIRYANNWVDPYTIGLNIIKRILFPISNNPKILFFSVTFLCTFLILLAYRMNQDANPYTLLYLVLSESFIYSFYLLKQAPAIALSAISITILLQGNKPLSFVIAILAVLFHESAAILIPMYFLIIFADVPWIRRAWYVFMLLIVIFFVPFTRIMVSILGHWFPWIIHELNWYIDETGAMIVSTNILTTIKGIPFYIITIYGFISRKRYVDQIPNYDKYLIMSFFSSITIVLSYYMYWMWRFGTYFFFPSLVFASHLTHMDKDREQGIFISLLIIASSGFLTLRYLSQIFFLNGGF